MPIIIILIGFTISSKFVQFQELKLSEKIVISIIVGISVYIIPAFVISIFLDKALDEVVFAYLTFGLIITSYQIFRFSKEISTYKFQKLKNKINEFNFYHILFILIIANYLILGFIYPLRGWDALNFYIPNAYYFYLTDDIPIGYNLLTLFPTIKAPLNSLLFSLNLYFFDGYYINQIPFLFVLGSSLLVKIVLIELDQDEKIAYFGSILFLLLPFTYIHFLEYYFYQELPLLLFYSSTIIYFYKYLKKRNQLFLVISSLSFSLAILSKITAYSLIIILPLIFQTENFKILRKILYTLLIIFLSVKASTEISIYFGIIIILVNVVLIIYEQKEEIPSLKIADLKLFFLPIIFGVLWIKHLSNYPRAIQTIISKYIRVTEIKIVFDPVNISHLSQIYMENSHALSTIMIISVIFLGQYFVSAFLIQKLIGIKHLLKENLFVIRWGSLFFSMWLAYHSNVSIRYLQPIFVPLVIITSVGIQRLVKLLSKNELQEDVLWLIHFLIAFLFFYPFLPIRYLLQNFHLRLFNFNTSLILLLIYVSLIILLTKKIGDYLNNKKISILSKVRIILCIFLVIAPSSVQIGVLIQNDFNIKKTQETLIYDNRNTVHELGNYLRTHQDIHEIVIGVNIPGISMISFKPTIDLITVGNTNITFSELTNNNYTELYANLSQNNIYWIITLLPSHPFYETYTDEFVNQFPFLIQPSSNFTALSYINEEFSLWQLLTT